VDQRAVPAAVQADDGERNENAGILIVSKHRKQFLLAYRSLWHQKPSCPTLMFRPTLANGFGWNINLNRAKL
jgi:hypothetical protein